MRIKETPLAALRELRLNGTAEGIPTFEEVLAAVDGRVPLIVELKTANGNHAALCEAACRMLESYNGPYCIESFDPRCIYWLRKHRPEIIRGQLASNFFRGSGKMPFILKLLMTSHLTSFITCPDFIAYKFADRKRLNTFLVRRLWGVQGVSWTIRSKEDFDTAVKEGWLAIFEGFLP